MNIQVYIPTRGRIGLNNQVTLREFLNYSSHIPVLVCPPDEASQHLKYAPRVRKCKAKGIGPTRQFILETSCADVVIMADDDMRFSYRPDPSNIKLERCTNLEVMLELIRTTVEDCGYIHGGVGARQGNNRKDLSGPRQGVLEDGHVFVDCERVNNMHFMDRLAVLDAGGRLDALPVMEDFYFTLTMLLKGFPNRVIHDYVWNQEGSGSIGGCSLYRTPQVQEKGANGLQESFPELAVF